MMKKKKRAISDGLGHLVRNRYETAKAYKSGTFSVLQDCVSMIRGESIVELDDAIEYGVQANIVAPIARGLIGMLRDIYGQNSDSPFTLDPTPIVDLPKSVQEELTAQLTANAHQMIADAGFDQAVLEDNLAGLKDTTLKLEQKRAALAAVKLTTLTQDALFDAGWKRAFEHEAIQNFIMFPTVIFKCPVYKNVMSKVWDGDRYSAEERTVMSVECISPFNIFPSPDATNAQDADYIIERRRITNSELFSLSEEQGYDSDGVDLVVDECPDGHLEPYENGAENVTDIHGGTADDENNPTMSYDTLGYFGKVSGKSLIEYGIVGVDDTRNYEAEIWTINDIVIKATLNPDFLGRRPFYSTSFEPIPNAFWGECPVTRVKEHQRACTSAIAHLFRNMSFASGPFIEREIARIEGDVDENELAPYVVVDIKASMNGNSGAAHRFQETASHSAEFIAIYDKFKAEAYDAIGIQKALFGGTDNMGGIGRTSGGIAAVYSQAGKALKYSMRLLEEEIIEPAIQRLVDNILQNSDDDTIKGDVKVRARGVSGIADKEDKREHLNWAMQSLVPLMQIKDAQGNSVIPPEAPVRLLYEQFKSMGIPTEGVFAKDYDVQSAIAADTGQSPQIVAQPTLDGRSPDAQAAIADMGGAQFNEGGIANQQAM